MSKSLLIVLLLCIYLQTAFAQQQCQQNAYRQFDFWLGNWQVRNLANEQLSTSRISSIVDGCAILEEYLTDTGFQGKSLTMYDHRRQLWHQTWSDNQGMLLQLEGQRQDGVMVLSGELVAADGKRLLQRISWFANSDGSVRQHWQQSDDNGVSWTTLFDGLYQKLTSTSPAPDN